MSETSEKLGAGEGSEGKMGEARRKRKIRRTFAQTRLLILPRPCLMLLMRRHRSLTLTPAIHRIVLPDLGGV
jgi:hypothetical protein